MNVRIIELLDEINFSSSTPVYIRKGRFENLEKRIEEFKPIYKQECEDLAEQSYYNYFNMRFVLRNLLRYRIQLVEKQKKVEDEDFAIWLKPFMYFFLRRFKRVEVLPLYENLLLVITDVKIENQSEEKDKIESVKQRFGKLEEDGVLDFLIRDKKISQKKAIEYIADIFGENYSKVKHVFYKY